MATNEMPAQAGRPIIPRPSFGCVFQAALVHCLVSLSPRVSSNGTVARQCEKLCFLKSGKDFSGVCSLFIHIIICSIFENEDEEVQLCGNGVFFALQLPSHTFYIYLLYHFYAQHFFALSKFVCSLKNFMRGVRALKTPLCALTCPNDVV